MYGILLEVTGYILSPFKTITPLYVYFTYLVKYSLPAYAYIVSITYENAVTYRVRLL